MASRRAFMGFLRHHADRASDLDAAELIFAELVGNAVRHAQGPVAVSVTWDERYATLCVHDEHEPFRPSFHLPDDPLQENGRGLFIVKALARSVKVFDIVGDGTKVVAELPVWLQA